MGQRASRSSHPPCRSMSLYGSFRRKRSKKGDLSATFHYLDADIRHSNLLNINLAAEEQLMTLPGITRTLARSIVEYRLAIGGFKKVEDIALVSGIGANKLQQFKGEITTINRNHLFKRSNDSSCRTSLSEEQSIDSFLSGESGRYNKLSKPLNVNSANIFRLMTIHGISQEMAANIVEYREKKGGFKTLDQLLKVRGMNVRILGAIRCYLTTEYMMDIENDSGVLDMKPLGEDEPGDQSIENCYDSTKCHRRSKSAPTKYSSCKDDPTDTDIFILLSNRSKRPVLKPNFHYQCDGKWAVRLASWDLEDFTEDKAFNLGAREVICRTILENGFGVLCLQNILSRKGIEAIVSELNKPTLPWVKQWPENNFSWKLAITTDINTTMPFSAFIYDSSQRIKMTSSLGSIAYASKHFSSAKFKIGELDLTFLKIVDTEYKNVEEEILKDDLKNCDKNVLVFCGEEFKDCNLKRACCEIDSNHLDNYDQVKCSHLYINIGASNQNIMTGRSGTISLGLNHLAIPNGWKLGGKISQHHPSWIELYAD